jgi:hypothetical protein
MLSYHRSPNSLSRISHLLIGLACLIAFLSPRLGLAQPLPTVQPNSPTGQPKWQEGFVLGGMDARVQTLAKDEEGNLYAGGCFRVAGGAVANGIARWERGNWQVLGSGVDNIVHDPYICMVYAITFDPQGAPIVGGDFTRAGGTPAKHVARWNGSAWEPLGDGVAGTVYALAADGSGNLYAGGYFASAGGLNTKNIANWNGSEWEPLGSGMDSPVYALALDDHGVLYAGGSFTTAGGVTVNSIAKWNGSIWESMGSDFGPIYMGGGPSVYSLALDHDGNLYAGGNFSSAGGDDIAKWNGTGWEGVGAADPDNPGNTLIPFGWKISALTSMMSMTTDCPKSE